MQLHTLQPKTKKKRRKYIGRGGKRGTTAGRGTKGQRARAGHRIRPEIRDIIKRIPKKRGYRFRGIPRAPVRTFSMDVIDRSFSAGDTVSVRTLRAKGLVPNTGARITVKILAGGALSKKLVFEGIAFSGRARESALESGSTIR